MSITFKQIINYFNYIYRNLKLKVNRNQTVIDIGSGHAPLIRADILCDLPPLECSQRPVTGIYTPPNRFVVGDLLNLPFGTKAFDFAYSRAVLEHVTNPIKACKEITRIAHSGLLILPSYLWEIMGGSKAHLWLISRVQNKLVFQRKTLEHSQLNSLLPEKILNSKQYEKLFNTFHEDFFIDYYWNKKISIEVKDSHKNEYNFEENALMISATEFINKFRSPTGLMRKAKISLYEILRKALGGRDINLFSVVACPLCKKSFSDKNHKALICDNCNLEYPIIDDIPFLMKRFAKELKMAKQP